MSIPSWAIKGAKVVCIDDKPHGWTVGGAAADGDMDGLTIGVIYTIREFGLTMWFGMPTIRLEEIIRILRGRDKEEAGYAITRFRPLVTRTQEQDISAYFKPLLSPERIDA